MNKLTGADTYVSNAQEPQVLQYIADRILPGRVTVPQFVVRVLREAIVTGALPSGTSLRQDSIAEDLKTSKIPVREALRELEGEGLVDFVPNRGFIVKETSYAEMLECFKVRRILEVFAVKESLPLATEAHLDRIETIIDDFEKVTDPMVTSQWNLRLHLAFYEPANMLHVEKMITRAHTIAQRYTHIYMRLNHAEIEPQDEHRAILGAYRAKDKKNAAKLMDAHISVAFAQFDTFLKQHFKTR